MANNPAEFFFNLDKKNHPDEIFIYPDLHATIYPAKKGFIVEFEDNKTECPDAETYYNLLIKIRQKLQAEKEQKQAKEVELYKQTESDRTEHEVKMAHLFWNRQKELIYTGKSICPEVVVFNAENNALLVHVGEEKIICNNPMEFYDTIMRAKATAQEREKKQAFIQAFKTFQKGENERDDN